MLPVLLLALATGLFLALYTTFDAYGIRATVDPFTFLALRGFVGGLIAIASFASIMVATRLDKMGEAAILREASTIFAAVIGWLVLKKTVGTKQIVLMALIALIVEFAG